MASTGIGTGPRLVHLATARVLCGCMHLAPRLLLTSGRRAGAQGARGAHASGLLPLRPCPGWAASSL